MFIIREYQSYISSSYLFIEKDTFFIHSFQKSKLNTSKLLFEIEI